MEGTGKVTEKVTDVVTSSVAMRNVTMAFRMLNIITGIMV